MRNTRSSSKVRTSTAQPTAGVCSNTITTPRISLVSAVTSSIGAMEAPITPIIASTVIVSSASLMTSVPSSVPTSVPASVPTFVPTSDPPSVTPSVMPSVPPSVPFSVRSATASGLVRQPGVVPCNGTAAGVMRTSETRWFEAPSITTASDDGSKTSDDIRTLAEREPVEGASVPCTLEQVNAELALLEAQERLLAARVQVQRLQSIVSASELPSDQPVEHKRKIKTADVEYLVSAFTGDDEYSVSKWIEDFEDIMCHLHGDTHDHYRMARHLVRGTAKIYLRTIRVKDYAELKKRALLLRYDRQVSYQTVYQQLVDRVRLMGERILTYITKMQEVAQ